MKRIVILNPKSRHGASRVAFEKMRPKLEDHLGFFDIYFTTAPKDCTRKVREILHKKEYDQILIAGGDGSINEAVNGYFDHGHLIQSNIPMGVINLGTGGDFVKTLNKRSQHYFNALRDNSYELVDCGVTTLEHGKEPHHFINITSIGMGGDMNRQMKASSFQYGMAAYFYHTLSVLFKYTPAKCKIKMKQPNGNWLEIDSEVVNFFVCNAGFSGGGMVWAPSASIEDGVFDIVLVSNVPKYKLITESHKVYSGKIASMTGVMEFKAVEIHVIPERTLSQEIDGEVREMDFLQTHEFHFKLIPKAIPMVI
ncbi:MAG TPA: diacylglycerol kinase family protein [Leptospiraceae bacterium]|nr:diacylglycerol kinase family protein [Leptospiraceae bacterium]HMW05054.1 diacylglycerol kinase family protein [Leptospiraceae bacterium]HMX31498.1 diacylglycerol kinase family protein [Leptospiraceae bacterium]HMY31649.1 diacylglycerol kinase family protein [Leptospiraceae bacterium]HMZ62607.1 diacylglycerol kinase family protein [Leptospiraceae bacterium]